MQQEPYATDPLLFYPARRMPEERKRRIETFEAPIDELTSEDIIHSMSRQIENNFQMFFTICEDQVGEEQTREIAYQMGRRYGGRGYASLLEAQGQSGTGSPRMMALYQDLVHAIRGPKHTSALFAEYDDERCVVRRRECVYFDERQPENGKYTGEFERGACDGYAAADENLLHTEVRSCRWKGDGHCEMHWVFQPAPERRARESR